MSTYAVRYAQPLLGAADSAGRLEAVPNASVQVLQDGDPCAVYASNDKDPLSNPVPIGVDPGEAGVDTLGHLVVYLEPGRGYTGVATVAGSSVTFPLPDISPDAIEPIDGGSP